MRSSPERNPKHSFLLFAAGFIIIVLIAVIAFLTLTSAGDESENTPGNNPGNPALYESAENLNQVLPQRLDEHTSFDSVAVYYGTLHYNYSIANMTADGFADGVHKDSLYTAAVDRIPCTLWRPVYMQGVNVTFSYFSAEGDELFSFTKEQQDCHERN
jgi:hypothetical protein